VYLSCAPLNIRLILIFLLMHSVKRLQKNPTNALGFECGDIHRSSKLPKLLR
jgi:hypothetical protein